VGGLVFYVNDRTMSILQNKVAQYSFQTGKGI